MMMTSSSSYCHWSVGRSVGWFLETNSTQPSSTEYNLEPGFNNNQTVFVASRYRVAIAVCLSVPPSISFVRSRKNTHTHIQNTRRTNCLQNKSLKRKSRPSNLHKGKERAREERRWRSSVLVRLVSAILP